MTKEELEKEAEEYAKENYRDEVRATARNAYLDCARLKEKQIQIDAEQIRALQKQNGELTDELTLTNNECKDMREELKQRIRENQKLCEQIEKMKMCCNCDRWRDNPILDKQNLDDSSYPCIQHNCDSRCSLWEIWKND